ncbi:MAG: peptidase U32 family protein [Bacteroidaceae bacterium]|nr:peptidase U32 family protein [Bacteroidaceae bacterium]
MKRSEFEIMAPVGCRESLAAAIKAGANSIYFGIGKLNMRSHSANAFTIDDLKEIAAVCHESGVKSYLTVNTIIYGEDIPVMREIVDAAKEAGISAVIASDVAVMSYCCEIGQEVHLSTQLNISNIEALKFYAQFADVVVLARELNMWQVRDIYQQIIEQDVRGPKGELIRIEMFCHGALCMAISGKCYLSLQNAGRSANRGECVQICRRGYEVTDLETGTKLDVDNKYIMSPRDLKTIRFIDVMMNAGVRVFKIEGRARGPEYVYTVVRAYDEAINAVIAGTFADDDKAKDEWDNQLSTVFNRGFWDGYYQGQKLGEWCEVYGSKATEKKVYVGKCMKYFSKIGVAEFLIENACIHVGDKILVTGPTTGALMQPCEEIRFDLQPVEVATKGQHVSIKVSERVRPNDKLYLLQPADRLTQKNVPAYT